MGLEWSDQLEPIRDRIHELYQAFDRGATPPDDMSDFEKHTLITQSIAEMNELIRDIHRLLV